MQEIRSKELYQKNVCDSAVMPIDWKQLSHKTILISGATGMIATFLIDVLMQRNREFHEDIRIIAVSRNKEKAVERLGIYLEEPEFYYLQHNVNEPFRPDYRLNGIDFIIHSASNTHPLLYSTDPIGTIEANVSGTRNLLELAAFQKNCRLVFLSSVEIYGENRGDTEKFSEDYCGYINCNTLRACYSEGKRLGETLCQAYISERQLDVVIPRLCRVYGPTMLASDSKAIAQLIKRAAAGEDIILKSEGLQLYSYVYVADAVSAILNILLRGSSGEAYNIADESSDYYLKDIAAYLADLNGKKVVYELPDEKEKKGYSTATKAILNPEKLRSIGWECMYSMQEGLRLTYEILRKG
jgi:nucleoside-diphosphate-sugar epimerase